MTHASHSAEDFEFDAVVSALEEVVMHGAFQDVQTNFCQRHCGKLPALLCMRRSVRFLFHVLTSMWSCPDKFSESSENKLEYTALFTQYSDMLEKLIEDKLKERIPVSFQVVDYLCTADI
ncbi:hypothetical protein EON64_07670 [archaeon]|nr:MAG: hypothetical protein EON64_07670 [archaeon]